MSLAGSVGITFNGRGRVAMWREWTADLESINKSISDLYEAKGAGKGLYFGRSELQD